MKVQTTKKANKKIQIRKVQATMAVVTQYNI